MNAKKSFHLTENKETLKNNATYFNFNQLELSLLENSLFKLRSHFSTTELPEKLQNISHLGELSSKLITLLKSNNENAQKMNQILVNCYLQVSNIFKFKNIDEDFSKHILPLLSNSCSNQEFFWTAMISNDYENFDSMKQKITFKNLLILIFDSENFFDKDVIFQKPLKETITILIKENEENILNKSMLFEQMILKLDINQKKNIFYQITKECIKENDLNSDDQFKLICEHILVDKACLKSNKFYVILNAMYTIFKNDDNFIKLIVEKLEGISRVVNKDKRNAILIFFGRIFSYKNPKNALTHAVLFTKFINSMNEKSFILIRKEIIQISLKFCQRFAYIYKKFNANPLILDEKENKILKFRHLIEKKLLECLFTIEKAQEIRIFIIDKIEISASTNNFCFSFDFFMNFLKFLSQGQDHFIKQKCLELIMNLFCCYYSGMFTEKCNIFENKNRVRVNENEIECTVLEFQKKSESFEKLFLEILFQFIPTQKNESLLMVHIMNSVFFSKYVDPSKEIDFLNGVFYLLVKSFYEKNQLFPDFKNKEYHEYLFKVLGSEWKMDEETLNNKKNFFTLKAFEKILKLKFKLTKLINESLFKKNINTKRILKEKILKYSGFLRKKMIKNVVVDAFDEFDKLYTNDKEFETAIDNIYNFSNIKKEEREKINIFSNEDFLKKYSNELAFLIKFIQNNKTFNSNFIDESIQRSLFFSSEVKVYENHQNFLFFISGLKMILIFLKFSDINWQNNRNIKNILKILKNICFIASESNSYNHKFIATSTMKKMKLEMINMKDYAITLSLKIFSKFENYSDIKIEKNKLRFLNLIKDNKKQLNDNQIKYLGIILKRFDDISSDKVFFEVVEDSLKNFHVKNDFFSKNINIIFSYLKNFKKSNFDTISENIMNIFDHYFKIIEKPISLSKSLVISNLTINKKKLLRIVYQSLFKTCLKNIDESRIKKIKNEFFSTLFSILINFNEVSASALVADKNYLRINSLDLLLKMIYQKEIPKDIVCDLFINFSMLCFEENLHFRKIFFKYLAHFALKLVSQPEFFIDIHFLSLLFLFTLDEDLTLQFLAKVVLIRIITTLGEKITKSFEKQKGFVKKDLEQTPEYLIIYLVFILLNNSFFHQNQSFDIYKITKLISNFFDIVFQINVHRRSLNFLIIMLDNLKKTKPKNMEISKSFNLTFYSIKKKNKEFQNEYIFLDFKSKEIYFKELNKKKTEEKYNYLLEILTKIFEENFNPHKIIRTFMTGVNLSLDSDFFDYNLEINETFEIIDSINLAQNKKIGSTNKKQPISICKTISKRKEHSKSKNKIKNKADLSNVIKKIKK